jgi:hypothetical protein
MTLNEIESLIDDLCLVHAGHKGDDESKDYSQAMSRIVKHGCEIKKQNTIKRLLKEIEILEGENNG